MTARAADPSPSAAEGGARPSRLGLAVVLVACAANLPSLAPGFIHDDHRIIEQNELIRGVGRLGEIVTQGYWSVGSGSVPILYRPVTILSFALNYAACGLRPFGYRLVDLLLHAFVSLLVFGLARRIFGRSPGPLLLDPALAAALLFAAHPVHTEVLGEVVGRAELLAAAGALGCVLAFLRARGLQGAGSPGARWLFGLALLAFALGFMAKENAVATPFLVLLADVLIVRRRPAWSFHAASACVLLLCLAARAAALGSVNPPGLIHWADNPIAYMPFVRGRLTALVVLGRYVLLLVAPLRQAIDYSYDAIPAATGILDPRADLGLALLAGGFAAVAAGFRRAPAAAFGIAWFGIALAPVANLLFPIGTIMAERLLYLPSVGFCVLAGAALGGLRGRFIVIAGRPGRDAAARAVVALLLAACAARSGARLYDWRDDYTIFKAALAVAPRSVRSLYNFGAACEDRGKDAEAARVYEQAIALWPDFADAHYNLAGVLGRARRWDDAVGHYREAVRLQPANVRFLVNLGHALTAQGNPAEARAVLERAVESDPRSAEAYTDLGAACLALGDPRAAARAYGEAAHIDPGSADYQRNLALAEDQAGDHAAAAEAYRRGLLLRPGDPDLLAGLGMALLGAGDAARGSETLAAAVRARPGQPIYRYQLARALEGQGRLTEAAEQYRESIRLAPSAPVPLKSLGLLLRRMGDRRGARESLERAMALDPQRKVMDGEAVRVLEGLRRAGSR